MNPNSSHEHARLRLDAVVRRGYHALRRSTRARSSYTRLLVTTRQHSNLLQPTSRGHRELAAVDALVRLAGYHDRFVREPETWVGGDGSRYSLVGSLAQHLLATYPVPPILACAWLGDASEDRQRMRRWCIEHGEGVPIRRLDGLPFPLTRAMEHHFLRSPPHLPLPAALRRAEVLGLGAPEALAGAIARTVLGRHSDEHAFWRPILRFLIDHREALTEHRTVAIIDAIDELQPRLRALDGGRLRPERLIRGRTPETLERTLADLQPVRSASTSSTPEDQRWTPTGIAGWVSVDPQSRVSWQIVELLGPQDLAREGRLMKHCVATYVGRCIRGTSRIWSLRWQCGDGTPEPRVTIEVSPAHRRVVQIRGPRNRRPPEAALSIIRSWTKSCGLTVAGSSL